MLTNKSFLSSEAPATGGFCRSQRCWVALLLSFFITSGPILAGPADFNIDGVFEASLDLPRILFLLKTPPPADFAEPSVAGPNGSALEYMGNFEVNWAFLDTGASGILLSREIIDYLQISIDPNAQYSDVGIGGIEFFDISEVLYIGTASYDDPNPYDQEHYTLSGPWRFQAKKDYAGPWPDEPLDLLGMPVMFGKTVVLNSRGPSNLEIFSADIKEPNDPTIPEVDFTVPLRFEKYITPKDPCNIPPLPVLAYNPVIDNITAEYGDNSSTGTWLLDTGATMSLISVAQAAALGLTDPDGNTLIGPDFIVPIGGIGGQVMVPGFEIDNLIIPTLDGYNLVFNNARIGVRDIGIIDEVTGEPIILDGIFGSNFFCATMNISTWELSDTAFDTIVIDMRNGLLGFDVNNAYPLPSCGDAQHPRPTADITGDCKVNFLDLLALSENWLRDDCNAGNAFCNAADINKNGKTDLADYTVLAEQWRNSPFSPACGDAEHPWPQGDLNRDCSVDFRDLRILAREWLNECNWLNWNCSGADLNSDKTVNFADYSDFINRM